MREKNLSARRLARKILLLFRLMRWLPIRCGDVGINGQQKILNLMNDLKKLSREELKK